MLTLFVFRIIVVDGDSMMSTLSHQEKIVISNFMYTPEKGDIIVTDNNNGYKKPLYVGGKYRGRLNIGQKN